MAWAVASALAASGCTGLFATHFHELTALESTGGGGGGGGGLGGGADDKCGGGGGGGDSEGGEGCGGAGAGDALSGAPRGSVTNLHMACALGGGPGGGGLTLLFEARPGPCDRSFGVAVAEAAGFPPAVVADAKAFASARERASGMASAAASAAASAGALGSAQGLGSTAGGTGSGTSGGDGGTASPRKRPRLGSRRPCDAEADVGGAPCGGAADETGWGMDGMDAEAEAGLAAALAHGCVQAMLRSLPPLDEARAAASGGATGGCSACAPPVMAAVVAAARSQLGL